jgi:hypothetical protein
MTHYRTCRLLRVGVLEGFCVIGGGGICRSEACLIRNPARILMIALDSEEPKHGAMRPKVRLGASNWVQSRPFAGNARECVPPDEELPWEIQYCLVVFTCGAPEARRAES